MSRDSSCKEVTPWLRACKPWYNLAPWPLLTSGVSTSLPSLRTQPPRVRISVFISPTHVSPALLHCAHGQDQSTAPPREEAGDFG